MTVTMKNLLAALLLCTHMLNPEAGVLHGGGEAVFDARTEKFENNKRCLLGETGDETFCGAHIDPLVMDEGSSFSEASFQASSPAPIEADMLGSDMGEPQVIDSYNEKEILERITQARLYMQQTVMTDEKFAKVRSLCKNVNSQCAFWASIGECENNPAYMKINCAPSCFSCEQLSIEARCPLDPNAVDAFSNGDLNKMFENIITDPYYEQFEPVVLSRPDYAPGDSPETVSYKVGSIWMVQFDNAISDEEADQLVELGGKLGYERSADVGNEKADGTYDKYINSGRTSTNAWCVDECYTDLIAERVMRRIENITGIPETNSENLQLLRYERDQFYQTHNDYIPYQADRPSGARILTFYFYLNDVKEGGGTDFPLLNMTVTPKKGRAVLWPSVFDSDPNVKDSRSDHQALPVIEGIKYGANAWIHQRDFKGSNSIGCT